MEQIESKLEISRAHKRAYARAFAIKLSGPSKIDSLARLCARDKALESVVAVVVEGGAGAGAGG